MARKKDKEPITGLVAPRKFNLGKMKDARAFFAQFNLMDYVERYMPPGMTIKELCSQAGISKSYLYRHRKDGDLPLSLVVTLSHVLGKNLLDELTKDFEEWMLENRLTRSLREQQKRDKETIYALNDRLIDTERQKEDYRDLLKGK